MQQQETGRRRRHWVARELHDRVGSELAVALRQLELVELHLPRDPERASERIAGGLRAVSEAMRVTRELADELSRDPAPRPAPGDLTEALRSFAARLAPDGTSVAVHVAGLQSWLPDPHKGQLFLILCEALRNAAVHADAEHVVVRLHITEKAVSAVVRDNGKGFGMTRDPDPSARLGMGLTSMRERAESLGGTVVVVSRPGRGTRVTLWMPLPDLGRPA
ncbi:sensor histidine kinase [Streptomyces sp. CG1]|uniref:sensor histidine kinase n=1 Tax=Streptomyces sp. CG1 TaxID=1287523 RepID=UPI0034E2D25F